MKFGKTIQSQQVPGWGDYYLNYKALKKIINSYAAGRPASDASLLSQGLRPPKRTPTTAAELGNGEAEVLSLDSEDSPELPPASIASGGSHVSLMERQNAARERNESFKAHRDVFFFTLQRELEKINAFYLVKERDLRLRLLTLLLNRKRLFKHLPGDTASIDSEPDDGMGMNGMKRSHEWAPLEEAWRLLERDLGKLQGFIEINATGFRKILKKWDKRSKSSTKEMYLERQVEVQPCFNREFIAGLSDVVAANLLDLENGSDKLPKAIFADLPGVSEVDELALDLKGDFDTDSAQIMENDAVANLEAGFSGALTSGPDAIRKWFESASRRMASTNDDRVMRVMWRAVVQVPPEQLNLVLKTGKLDFSYVDHISGRTPLHQACIAGSLALAKICLEKQSSLLESSDSYQRRPLHYAAMHGHADIVSFLLQQTANPAATDMDGYTSLMHAIVKGQLEAVKIFVEGKITIEPTSISHDLIPLSLACQHGQYEITRILLECGARILPNSDGMFPQHFAAKAGHEDICRLLIGKGGPNGGGKDRQDKYNLWTPMHHAAVGGEARHLACIKVLVAAGCDVNASDEYGKTPGWYSAWYGRVECLKFLLASGAQLSDKQDTLASMENLGLSADSQSKPDGMSPGSDLDLDAGADDIEPIPSLSLPPPIIPLRVYGHEFLAHKCLVQLSLGHPFSRTSAKPPPVKLYSRSGQDPLHLWSSLKLVMTSKSDITSVPHSVILPLADDREVFSFQVESLNRFCLEFSLYPTFGSKVIGRAVILPSTFLDIQYHKEFIAPLLDHQLKTIGEVAFEVSCITPFEEAQLEIGGRVETYWKSKVTPSASSQDHAHTHQTQSQGPLSITTSSSTSRPAPIGSSAVSKEATLVTSSSLVGEYVEVIVQVTADGIPVAWPYCGVPHPEFGLNVCVADIPYHQLESLAESQHILLENQNIDNTPHAWMSTLSHNVQSLEKLLQIMPSDIGINLQLRYERGTNPNPSTRCSTHHMEVNKFVDCILHKIYDAGKISPGRKIIFSSFDPTVCTALNWKQPNYAVFFASYCGITRSSTDSTLEAAAVEEENDLRCLSVRAAANFAKSTNLLGVILEATTLSAVPSLRASVQDAGLLLATFEKSSRVSSALENGHMGHDGRKVDPFVTDGILNLSV